MRAGRLFFIILFLLVVSISSPFSAEVYTVRARDTEITVLYLVIHRGSRDDPKGKEGLSHLLEHLFFRGKGCREKFKEELDKIGAVYNAETSWEWTTFHFVVPRKNAEKLMKTIECKLRNPYFSQEEFQVERRVVINEMRMRTGYSLWKIFSRVKGELGFDSLEGGTPDTLSSITYAEALEELKNRLRGAILLSNYRASKSFLELPSSCPQGNKFPLNSPPPKFLEMRSPRSGVLIAQLVPGVSFSPRVSIALDVIGLTFAERSPFKKSLDEKSSELEVSLDYPTRCYNSTFSITLFGEDLDPKRVWNLYLSFLREIADNPSSFRDTFQEAMEKLYTSEMLSYDNPLDKLSSTAYWVGLGRPHLAERYSQILKSLSEEDFSQAAKILIKTKSIIIKLREE